MNRARPTDPAAPFISAESRRIPSFICESAWLEHAPFAAWLVEKHRPAVFVELGVQHGFSYLAVCEALQRQGILPVSRGIDTWRGDDHAGIYDNSVLERLRAYHDPRYGDFSELVQSTFDAALPSFADGSIDLLHIDGQHYYEDVSHDFASWLPKMSARGIVLFHDTAVRERGFGVFRLWAEVGERFRGFNFEHGHGLGVLAVGSGYHPALEALFAIGLDEAEAAPVRGAYAELGGAITRLWRERSAGMGPAGGP